MRTSRSSWVTGRISTVPAEPSDIATVPLRLVVDLRPLQAPREVDVDRLPLGVRVERGVTRLAVAVAGLLPTAEREVSLGPGRARVDVYDARLEVPHRPEGRVRVPGEYRGAEAVARLVDGGCRVFVEIDRDHREHRA